ncbi:MAG: amicyanin [Ancylobacter novellus]|uniref:Amicyanin n=1 Tax=Ancylobacter novellus TaxID=921 RepID=A0A2W5MRF1_ANCNO|nr:MAG: amicyanin [Ancylobacter novellus]
MTKADALPALDRRSLIVAGAVAAAAVVLAPRRAGAAEPAEVVEGAGGTQQIEIKDMAFGTPEVTIKVGESVTWTNKDEIAHNVHMRTGPMKGNPKAQGPMLSQNQTYTLKFNEPGTYIYICTPHPMMKGKVIVEA